METETANTNVTIKTDEKKPDYRMVRRGRGANVHMVPMKRRKGRGRRCLKL